MDIQPQDLGTLELDGQWVPYVDLYDDGALPTRVRLGADEYAFNRSYNIFGHSAVMPQAIRELRTSGKKAMVVQRKERYYVFVSPP